MDPQKALWHFPESRRTRAVSHVAEAGGAEGLCLSSQVLSCLATLLRKQDLEAWSFPVTLQVYHGLLSFTVHTKPKVSLWDPGRGGGGHSHSRKPAGAGLLSWPREVT